MRADLRFWSRRVICPRLEHALITNMTSGRRVIFVEDEAVGACAPRGSNPSRVVTCWLPRSTIGPADQADVADMGIEVDLIVGQLRRAATPDMGRLAVP